MYYTKLYRSLTYLVLGAVGSNVAIKENDLHLFVGYWDMYCIQEVKMGVCGR